MFEDISGRRIQTTDHVGGTLAAASGTRLIGTRVLMDNEFTIKQIAMGAGTTLPAGTVMRLKVYVNGVSKGLAAATLTAGAGAAMTLFNGLNMTGPANSIVDMAVHTVGLTAGVGGRFQYRYYHGWSIA